MPFFDITNEDRIMTSKVKLGKTHPFFAYILMNMRIMKLGKDNYIQTMGVNEIGDLFYADKFVTTLSQPELDGVLAHEAMHMATNTFQREGKRDRLLWNISTDYIINYLILKEGFLLPKEVLRADENNDIVIKPQEKGQKEIRIKLDDNTFAEDLYDKLLQDRDQVLKSMGVTEIWIDGNGQQYDGKGGMPKDQTGYRKVERVKGQFDHHLGGDQDEKGESQNKLKSEADHKANEQQWKSYATEASIHAKQRGKLSEHMERHVNELLEPKIDWRKKLISFVSKDLPIDYTMRLPGRRTQALGIYFPSVVRENVEVFVAVDVSGSISGDEYRQFLSEILGIARGFSQVKMKVIFWSTYVDPADDLDMRTADENILINHVVKNSGGTTISCIKDYCEERHLNPRMMIILTDGHVETNPVFLPNTKLLFVLSINSNDSIVSNFGEVCKLADVGSPSDK